MKYFLIAIIFISSFKLAMINHSKLDLSTLDPVKLDLRSKINWKSHKHALKRIQPILNEFKKDMIAYNNYSKKIENIVFQLDIDFIKNTTMTALCLEKDNIILIDYNYFHNAPKSNLKNLVYHELGHCIYDYAHRSHGIMSYKFNNTKNYVNAYKGEFFDLKNEYKTNTELYSYKNKVVQEFMDVFFNLRHNSALGETVKSYNKYDIINNVLKTQLAILVQLFLGLLGMFLIATFILSKMTISVYRRWRN